jgi:phosphoribosylamine--glycine ligase
MRVLVVGGGAREHALVARLSQEVGPDDLIAAPGNPGIARLVRTEPIEVSNLHALAQLARHAKIDLTIVGPEVPLSLGIAELFADSGCLLFGPTAAAARLETSKAFAKAFMARHHIPTARYITCDTAADALSAVRSGELGWPLVLKADGLAAGKGVVIAETLREAEEAVIAAMSEDRFGAAGHRLVIEECLTGPEVSFFVISDGVRALPIGTAQDHKRIFDGDQGPNTGGMGAFAPSPLMDVMLHGRIMSEIVQPVITGMDHEGSQFRGFLYVGLMLTDAGPKVIEFNVRLGDPEAQVVLPRVADPLLPLLAAAARGQLVTSSCEFTADALVGVVLASRGYPQSSESNQKISGLDEAARETGVSIFHAGTATRDGQLVTAGGRVLTVIGRGRTFAAAIDQAYRGIEFIHFDGMQYRKDIGRKAMAAIGPDSSSNAGAL